MVLKLKSPAKINLFLNIIGTRSDGYHLINTLFERISLYDELEFTLTEAPGVVLETRGVDPQVPAEENIIFKAASMLSRKAGKPYGAHILLNKRIPVGAGLGGGSSNAACALRGLAELWSLNIDNKELMKIAASLGADIPFFLMDAARAVGRGIGDEIEPVSCSKSLNYVIINPGVSVSTGEVYKAFDEKRDLTIYEDRIKLITYSIEAGDFASLSELVYNDLETVTFKLVPLIKHIKELLAEKGTVASLMTGSGSTVFAICKDKSQADDVCESLRDLYKDWFIESVRTF